MNGGIPRRIAILTVIANRPARHSEISNRHSDIPNRHSGESRNLWLLIPLW